MFFVYSAKFNENYRKNYVNLYHDTTAKNINNQLKGMKEEVISLLDNNSDITLNNQLDLGLLPEYPFKTFLKRSGNTFSYDNQVVSIETGYLKEQNFGFFLDYLYIFSNDTIAIIDYQQSFDQILSSLVAEDVLLMDNQGKIYLNYDQPTYKNVLHEYLPVNTNEYFHDYFSKNKDLLINVKINNNEMMMSFTTLPDFTNLYVASLFATKNIKAQTTYFNYFLILVSIVMIFLNLLVLNYIYYTLHKKTADIEKQRLKHYYAKPYIMKINRKGYIKSKNKRLNTVFLQTDTKYKTVFDLFGERNNPLEKIQRGAPLIYSAENEIINFIPVKFSGGFYLVGENFSKFDVFSNEVYVLAYYNPITNLANQHLFLKRTDEIITELKQTENEIIHFVGFEVTTLKHVSSHYNKIIYNMALKEISAELINFFEKKIIPVEIFHTDADKFVVIMKKLNSKEVEKLSLEVIKHFERPLLISKNNIDVKIIGGVVPVLSQTKALNPSVIYSQINETLKRSSYSQTEPLMVFDETITHFLTERQRMEKDLFKAIENQEFVPYLQPQYNNKLNRVTGFEALLRWNHPVYIKKSPQEFINIAEENGMIIEIGHQMMEKTFAAAKELEPYNVRISLNISPVQMLRQGFTEELLELFRKYDLKKGSITLEITETTLLQSFSVVNDKIKMLKKNGIQIDLDDFGTGYSSLSYIKELSFDTIKIDKSFIDYIETDKYSKAIVNMIISLADTLEVDIVAEGVENVKQMEYLVRRGCHTIQGFYISKAIPLAEAIEFLKIYNVEKTQSFQLRKGRS